MPSSAAPAVCALSLHDALPISVLLLVVVLAARAIKRLLRPQIIRIKISGPTVWFKSARHGPGAGTIVGTSFVSPFYTGFSWTGQDRKSTRLNSSHVAISYAVFCRARGLRAFPTRRSSDLGSAAGCGAGCQGDQTASSPADNPNQNIWSDGLV